MAQVNIVDLLMMSRRWRSERNFVSELSATLETPLAFFFASQWSTFKNSTSAQL